MTRRASPGLATIRGWPARKVALIAMAIACLGWPVLAVVTVFAAPIAAAAGGVLVLLMVVRPRNGHHRGRRRRASSASRTTRHNARKR